MQQVEPSFEIKHSIPRTTIQKIRKGYPAPSIEESVAKAFDAFMAQMGPGVHISEKTLREMATIFVSEEITSEDDLVKFARERFKVSSNQVLVEIDPTLSFYIRESAESEKIPFATSVSNYFHQMFAMGWANQYNSISFLAFDQKQWKRLKELLGKTPLVGERIVRIVEDWKLRSECAVLPAAQKQISEPVAPPLQEKEPTAAPVF